MNIKEVEDMNSAFETWWKDSAGFRGLVSPKINKADAKACFSFGWIFKLQQEVIGKEIPHIMGREEINIKLGEL